MANVKLRLEGLPADVEACARLLGQFLVVLEESKDYHNHDRSQFVRRYIMVATPETAAAAQREGSG